MPVAQKVILDEVGHADPAGSGARMGHITSQTRTPAMDCWFNARASSSRATVSRNQPMKASHTPLRRDRVRNFLV